MPSHLILGLGGTGDLVVRALRNLHSQLRTPAEKPIPLSCLAVDTDSASLNTPHPRLGPSVAGADQVLLTDGLFESEFRGLLSRRRVAPWAGPAEYLQSLTFHKSGGLVCADQKRRIGRYLLAYKIDLLLYQIRNRVTDLVNRNRPDETVVFHVCLGAAGGTGSGVFLDLLAQLRAHYPDENRFRIMTHVLFPELEPQLVQSRNRGHFLPNAAATLHSLSLINSDGQLVDLTEKLPSVPLKSTSDPVFLFSDARGDGTAEESMARFIWKNLESASWRSLDFLQVARTTVDNFFRERRVPTLRPPLVVSAFREKLWHEAVVSEIFMAEVGRQCVNALLGGQWAEGSGFTDTPGRVETVTDVPQSFFQRVGLTEGQLSLSDPLTEEMANQKWKTFQDDWQDSLAGFLELAQYANQKNWIEELRALCEKRFYNDFRGMGVENFFAKKGDRKVLAQGIRQSLEKHLVREFSEQRLTLAQFSTTLESTASHVQRIKDAMAERIRKTEHAAEESGKLLLEVEGRWTGLGVFASVAKRRTVLEEAGDHLMDLYLCRTQVEGWRFARQLCDTIAAELADLRGDIRRLLQVLEERRANTEGRLAATLRQVSSSADGILPSVQHIPEFRDFVLAVLKERGYSPQYLEKWTKLFGSALDAAQPVQALVARLQSQSFEQDLISVPQSGAKDSSHMTKTLMLPIPELAQWRQWLLTTRKPDPFHSFWNEIVQEQKMWVGRYGSTLTLCLFAYSPEVLDPNSLAEAQKHLASQMIYLMPMPIQGRSLRNQWTAVLWHVPKPLPEAPFAQRLSVSAQAAAQELLTREGHKALVHLMMEDTLAPSAGQTAAPATLAAQPPASQNPPPPPPPSSDVVVSQAPPPPVSAPSALAADEATGTAVATPEAAPPPAPTSEITFSGGGDTPAAGTVIVQSGASESTAVTEPAEPNTAITEPTSTSDTAASAPAPTPVGETATQEIPPAVMPAAAQQPMPEFSQGSLSVGTLPPLSVPTGMASVAVEIPPAPASVPPVLEVTAGKGVEFAPESTSTGQQFSSRGKGSDSSSLKLGTSQGTFGGGGFGSMPWSQPPTSAPPVDVQSLKPAGMSPHLEAHLASTMDDGPTQLAWVLLAFAFGILVRDSARLSQGLTEFQLKPCQPDGTPLPPVVVGARAYDILLPQQKETYGIMKLTLGWHLTREVDSGRRFSVWKTIQSVVGQTKLPAEEKLGYPTWRRHLEAALKAAEILLGI